MSECYNSGFMKAASSIGNPQLPPSISFALSCWVAFPCFIFATYFSLNLLIFEILKLYIFELHNFKIQEVQNCKSVAQGLTQS